MGDGTGYIARVADTVEGLQLDMAAELLAHAADLLADNRTSYVQLRFLGNRMTEAPRDVVRIAHSRGARLWAPEREEKEAGDPRGSAAER
ncbi:hypothetical protein ABT330_20465 [Streptomyces sp. NPDC000658]|uniref:hypothetical protein n=1 Tax=Streptomyces sp. NPDC000658 TaxID=3154266 RepID=UPI00331B5DE5